MRQIRQNLNEFADELSDEDALWSLCRTSQRQRTELIALAADCSGERKEFQRRLGYANKTGANLLYHDGGFWNMFLAWCAMFVPQWESKFMSAVKDLTTMPDPEAVLEAIATALNISPEVLTHFAEHQGEIKTFLETQRGTLGLLAETKLWQLVGEGDAATVRWALQRLRPDIYGDKLTGGSTDEKTPRTIRIIEQD